MRSRSSVVGSGEGNNVRRWCLFAALALPLAGESLLQIAANSARPRENPYGTAERAARAGAKLYHQNCEACHGVSGRGNGRNRTPSLGTPTVKQAAPGALFWVLENGSANHRMPSFEHLPEKQRWQIITYLKTL
jgi:mono/diheme cytochrome c family protein